MVRTLLPASMALVAVLAVLSLAVPTAEAGGYQATAPFANYYVSPAAGSGTPQMYLAPRPTPPLVGHTYVTYQPLAPHEFLYPHKRTYYTHHGAGNGGLTRTKVRWSHRFDWHSLLCPPKVIYPNHCFKNWEPGF